MAYMKHLLRRGIGVVALLLVRLSDNCRFFKLPKGIAKRLINGDSLDQRLNVPSESDYTMVATSLLHPLDVLKLRQQLSPSRCTSYQFASQIYKYEGWKAFYCGITAGLLRQATYTATRLAVYDFLFDRIAGQFNQKPKRSDKVTIAVMAGMAGALVGNPSEVVLVRRMAGGNPAIVATKLCCHSFYNVEKYKGTIDALKRIRREEGYAGLWRGTSLTLLRSVFISIGRVGMYVKIREQLKKNDVSKDRHILSFVSSLMTSFIIAVVTHPIDMLKSLYQSSNQTPATEAIVKRIILCRGAKHLWSGFTPYFLRMTLHTVATFMILEEFKRCAKLKKEAEEKENGKHD